MWFLKFLLLLTIVMASAPKEIQLTNPNSFSKITKVIMFDFESEEEEQEEEENEELAA